MLVLTRRVGETLVIDGGKVLITIVRIRGSQVQVGVKAEGMAIDRQEVHERKTRDKQRVEGGGNHA